ncbi:MAG: ATP-dependent DNA helicase RecG [Phycisphaerales bacterium]|nr:ATP-dependent DNA helicase RecG [Phycisphaerales bacterium]
MSAPPPTPPPAPRPDSPPDPPPAPPPDPPPGPLPSRSPSLPAITLTTPIHEIAGIPRPVVEGLIALELTNVGRLVAHLPSRHEQLEAEASIDNLVPDTIVSARGTVTATRVVMRRPRLRFEAVLMDATGRLDVVWFNGTYLREQVQPGTRLRVQGKLRRVGHKFQLANPSFTILREDREPEEAAARIRPVYRAGEGLTSRQVERAVLAVLGRALPLIEEHLPERYRKDRELPLLPEAYRMQHMPRSFDEVGASRRRLAFDELLLLQLGVHMKRAHLRQSLRSPALRWSAEIDARVRERFPFTLTPSQDAVVADLVKDLTAGTPTNRLIQGDVGSGKTVVALYAMLLAVASGHQAALMAPTEILAEQHEASIRSMLAGSRVRVELLTGATEGREGLLPRLAAGDVDILVGTHALLTEDVRFASLGVAVIDEQHRFGVHQRATLRQKATGGVGGGPGLPDNRTPHVVVMTATPIPRTLAITLFGDLDISTIAGLPPGRMPITTRVVGPEQRDGVYAFVRARLEAGEQAFIVVPTIDPGDAAPEERLEDVRSLVRRLEGGPLKGRRIAALHGRLKRGTRDTIMERFRAGRIDAVVATTVIEVGVDVPNATLMVVENADRFGLAQLHQLRGRVGRGSRKSACVLIAGERVTDDARARLEAMASTRDGFVLAERDFALRGPGELFGTRQSGLPPFQVADLGRDLDLLKLARRDAAEWIAASPRLARPEEAVLLRRLLKVHGASLGLGDVG